MAICYPVSRLRSKENSWRQWGTLHDDERITALSWQRDLHNSMKLRAMNHAMQGHPRRTGHSGMLWLNVIHWGSEWQTTPELLLTLKDEPPRSGGVQHATEEEQKITTNGSKKNKAPGQSENNAQLWMCLVMTVKSNQFNDDSKEQCTQEPGMLGPWIKVNWMWPSRRWQE